MAAAIPERGRASIWAQEQHDVLIDDLPISALVLGQARTAAVLERVFACRKPLAPVVPGDPLHHQLTDG